MCGGGRVCKPRQSPKTLVNVFCNTYEWVMWHLCMHHVAHMHESCRTYARVVHVSDDARVWFVRRCNALQHHLIPRMNKSRQTCHTYEWVISHTKTSHVAHLNVFSMCVLVAEFVRQGNALQHRHVTRMNEPRQVWHTYSWVMWQLCMSHVAHMNESSMWVMAREFVRWGNALQHRQRCTRVRRQNRFLCVCDMTHSYLYDEFTCTTTDSRIRVTWLIHMCDMWQEKKFLSHRQRCPCVRRMRVHVFSCMGWLRLVGSLEWQVSFAEYSLFYRALLQERQIVSRSLKRVHVFSCLCGDLLVMGFNTNITW